MKLNLGCGYGKLDGWLNVDKAAACNPDQVVDLEQTPWPFADNSADEVLLSHVLEHLGAEPEVFFAIIRELYRVCRHGAEVRIHVPHPRHDDFINDPTHVRAITPDLLCLFSKRQNRIWQEAKASNTLLAFYLDVDFEVRRASSVLDPRYADALSRGQMTEAQLGEMARSYNNVIREYAITLEAVKA
jgi:SAM-dependent methyltransferase